MAEQFRAFYDLISDRAGMQTFTSTVTANEVAGHEAHRALDGDILTTWQVTTAVGATHPRLSMTFSPEISGSFDMWVGVFNHNIALADVDLIKVELGASGGPYSSIIEAIPLVGDPDQVHINYGLAGSFGEIRVEFEHATLAHTLSIGQVMLGLETVDFDELPTEQLDGDMVSVFPGASESARGIAIGRGGFGLRETFPIGGENLTPAQADGLLDLWKATRGAAPFALHMDDHNGTHTAWNDDDAIPGEFGVEGRGGAYLVQPGSERLAYRRLHTGRRDVSFPVRRQIP